MDRIPARLNLEYDLTPYLVSGALIWFAAVAVAAVFGVCIGLVIRGKKQ